jgi:hypothetical protein
VLKLLCGDVEDLPETSMVVTAALILDRLRKSAIRSQHKRAVYYVFKFVRDISEQPEQFSSINIKVNLPHCMPIGREWKCSSYSFLTLVLYGGE